MRSYLLLFTLLLCQSALIGKETVHLFGKITSPREQQVRLSMYSDMITFEPMQYTTTLKADNSFEFDVKILDPTTATLTHGNSSIELFLEPGDELHIDFHGWDIEATAEFSGSGAANNYYFLKAHNRFKRLSEEFVIYKMSQLDPVEFRKFMDDTKAKKQAFYDKYKAELQFSATFDAYAKADIDYWWANSLMRYRWEHAFYNDLPSPMPLPDTYFSFLSDVQPLNDAAVTNMNYIYFIDQFLEFQSSRNVRYNSYGAPITEKYRGAKRFLQGKPMFYVLANEFYIKCKSKETYSIGNDIKEFLETCPYATYTDLVRTEFAKANGLAMGSSAPNFTLTDLNGRPVSLSDFRGKVVYLDFWATWCMPCTYEILNSDNLKSQFEGKDVVFVYISLDSNTENWRAFIDKHHPAGIHLFAQGMYQSEVSKNYNVRGLPSFFLIDKDGNLARVPAKRSSEPGVLEEIEEFLAK